MANLLNFCLSISLVLFINFKLSIALQCVMCKESQYPNQCGATFNPLPATIPTIDCDETCVTFKNAYDNGLMYRNCTKGLWIPPTGKYNASLHDEPDCIKDRFSGQLFCFCKNDSCNGNNTGNLAIFDMNECASNPCKNGGNCTDLYNQFKCTCTGNFVAPTCSTCKPGFTGTQCNVQMPSPCVSNPCLNGGSCITELSNYTYTCSCPEGYNGTNCQIKKNYCLPNLCENKGICNDLPTTYSCTCPTGLTGKNCEIDIDECSLTPLICGKPETGACNNTFGSYFCSCNPGYTGKTCDIDINECASNPCLNRGTCNDLVAQYTCNCSLGYAGLRCEEIVGFCVTSPCLNDGSCRDDFNNGKFICDCAQGFTGNDCGTEIDLCTTIYPCKFSTGCAPAPNDYTCTCIAGYEGKNCTDLVNNCVDGTGNSKCIYGKCTNLVNNYRCVCTAGFTGKNCDEEIDECLSDPCIFGDCTNLINGFKCTCKSGYTGSMCDIDINECASNPCINGGTCVDLVDSYACICDQKNFKGNRCDQPINKCFEPTGVKPCGQHGICSGGIGSAPIQCICDQGFSGEFCQNAIPKCIPNICQNGGTCVENSKVLAGYTCVCGINFSGQNCETKISPCADLKINCNFGVCVDAGADYSCKCSAGYSGTFCTQNTFTCTSVGTFPDPAYCSQFIYCTLDANNKLVATVDKCGMLATNQLLFHPDKKTCVLKSGHPTPSCNP